MDNLVISLGVGVSLIAALFFVIYRFTRLRGYQTAGLVLAITLLIFVPYSVIHWAGADVFAIHLALYVIVPYGLGIITSQLESEQGQKARTGRLHWFHITLIVFFGIVATVNAILLTVATHGMPSHLIGIVLPEPQGHATTVTSGFPGTVSGITERKEALAVTYQGPIEQRRALGWQVDQGWTTRPEVGEPATLKVRVRDREGQPIPDALVTGQFLRISDFHQDQNFTMRPLGDGLYAAEVILSAPGRWDVVLRVEHGEWIFEQEASTRVRASRG